MKELFAIAFLLIWRINQIEAMKNSRLADRFPIVMMQSLTAAQILQENFMKH
jgi:hypothetical protein